MDSIINHSDEIVENHFYSHWRLQPNKSWRGWEEEQPDPGQLARCVSVGTSPTYGFKSRQASFHRYKNSSLDLKEWSLVTMPQAKSPE